MESGKLKNIVILILVITNLCLLTFAVQREYQEARLRAQALEDVVRFLAARGVAVDGDSIPDAGELPPQTVVRNLEREGALAARLLGEEIRTQAVGAEVYRYSNDSGSLQFHSDGALFGEFTPGVFFVGEDRVADCLKFLAKLDFQGELIAEEEELLTFRQLWQGTPLFSQQITLEVENRSITALTVGRRLPGEPAPDPSRQPVSTPTALIQFLNGVTALGDVCGRVDSILPGYVAEASLSGPMTLTPVWQIFTDIGAYQLDLVTGELTRVTQETGE